MGSAVFRVGSFCCLKVQQKNAWGEHLSGEPRKYREKNSWANNCNTLPTFCTKEEGNKLSPINPHTIAAARNLYYRSA